MTVYVDDMYLYPMGQYGRMKMSHLIADTDEELHAMAEKVGVARRWWQSPAKTSGSHYDIAISKRSLAIEAGAVPITLRQLSAMNTRRRITGDLGGPNDAVEWLANHMAHRRPNTANSPSDCAKADERLSGLDEESVRGVEPD